MSLLASVRTSSSTHPWPVIHSMCTAGLEATHPKTTVPPSLNDKVAKSSRLRSSSKNISISRKLPSDRKSRTPPTPNKRLKMILLLIKHACKNKLKKPLLPLLLKLLQMPFPPRISSSISLMLPQSLPMTLLLLQLPPEKMVLLL